MQRSRWHTSPLPYDTVRKLSSTLGISEILASVLARRGLAEPGVAREFLSTTDNLHDPFLFPEMEPACNRIRKAVSSGERICVHGDYDVDGITATALLADVIGEAGGNVTHHLPNRFSEGYGVAAETVNHLAADGVTLLITVDCGISAGAELSAATGLGMDTIIVDHHRPVEGSVPDGLIISPLLCDYPFKELAGVGLAFKLAQGLLADRAPGDPSEGLHPALQRQLDRVALGTIADVVPLVDENRALVKRGLVQLSRTRSPGLRALMQVSKLESSRLSAGLVAFRLAPRINAAGRLGEPDQALALLMCQSEDEAQSLAADLDSLNRERQRIENRILAEAREMVGRLPEKGRGHHGFVLSSPGWHEGVIGIVASRMVDIHHRPVIMISEGENEGKGSGRSIPAFDLHGALVELGGRLSAFGGHRAACGLTIDLEQLQAFSDDFTALAERELGDADLTPSRRVDALVCGRELTLDLAEELARLEPFGLGNPSVDLVAAGAHLNGCRKTRDGNHLQCRVESGGSTSNAIGFGQAHMHEKIDAIRDWDVVFRLEKNEFNGSVSPQLNLKELIPRGETAISCEALCTIRCTVDCGLRVSGGEFWSMVRDGMSLPQAWISSGDAGPATDRIIDRRGFGAIPQQIARLAAGGERILLIVADVARRQRLLTHELPVTPSMVSQAFFCGSRCSRNEIERRASLAAGWDGESSLLVMADLATISGNDGFAAMFDHLVFVDPPFNGGLLHQMATAAPEAWLHLIYCEDELQFTEKVLEHEYSLQAPLKRIYRHLKTGEAHPLDESTERLLLAGGKYLRQPSLVARCLAVLRELDLVLLEDTGDGPILTLPDRGKTELERSPTYAENEAFYQRCLKYLNKSRNQKTT